MSNLSKTLVTIGIIAGFLILFAIVVVLKDGKESGGSNNPGIFGIILFFGMMAGIRAVWKKSDLKNDDNQKLNKE